VRRARREGWFDAEALDQICRVFNIAGHGPAHSGPGAVVTTSRLSRLHGDLPEKRHEHKAEQ